MKVTRAIRLQHLHLASWVLLISGVLLLAIGMIMSGGELWQLVGLMLILAGGVKVAVIFLWRRLAGLETDRHHPIPPS